MSMDLYSACAQVLSLGQSTKDDLEALLHPEKGFAPRLRQICIDQLAELEENAAEGTVSLDEIEALRMESDTWALLQALMPLRKTAPLPIPSPRELLASNPYTPPATLAHALTHTSPLLASLVVVREWAHETAPPPPPGPGAATGYWRFTRHVRLQALRTGKNDIAGMDPDVVNRGEGGALAVDDAAYDRALLQTLYACVRAGRLDEAISLCRKAQQPWRAASLRGALLFQWRAIANEPRELEDDEDFMVDIEEEGWRGTIRRRLWKTTCTRAALNPALSATERALYAALAPSPQTTAPLHAACRTWADRLWAFVCVACEERVSSGLARLEDMSFWEGGLNAVEGTNHRQSQTLDDDEEEAEWEREVLGALEGLGNIAVDDGAPADNPYHVSQLHIILDRTDALLSAFAHGLKNGLYDTSSPEYPTMTRFFAHLCLYLQLIDLDVPPLAMQVILEAYLQVLEAAGQRDLIAMYAGALGDNAVERYALFLTSLELSADATERRTALTRARDHGLDVERVAVATAERTIERAFAILPQPKGPLPSVIGMQPPPSDAECLLVRSLEWTTFFESTYDTALEQANVILRYFLGCGRVQVAKIVLDMLPPELGAFREPEERATEYLHYRQFFTVWEALARVTECQALEATQMTKDTRTAWLSDYKLLLDQARDQVTKLLTTDWLVTDPANDVKHRFDLVRIRRIYIPELIIRLHAMLTASRHKLSENLKHALELVNIVADSRYKLYDDFSGEDGRRLGDYLGAVRQAILYGLEGGGSDPFRVITSL